MGKWLSVSGPGSGPPPVTRLHGFSAAGVPTTPVVVSPGPETRVLTPRGMLLGPANRVSVSWIATTGGTGTSAGTGNPGTAWTVRYALP